MEQFEIYFSENSADFFRLINVLFLGEGVVVGYFLLV